MIKNHHDMCIPDQQKTHWTHLLSLLLKRGNLQCENDLVQLPQASCKSYGNKTCTGKCSKQSNPWTIDRQPLHQDQDVRYS